MALSEEIKEKLRKKYKKLAEFIIKNEITEKDVFDVMLEDYTFQTHRDIVGKVSDYFEWRVHPTMSKVSCSTRGDISVAGTIITPVESGGELKIILSKGKTKSIEISAASLVLATFVPQPTDGVYIPHYRNQDFRDLRISNLYWYKVVE